MCLAPFLRSNDITWFHRRHDFPHFSLPLLYSTVGKIIIAILFAPPPKDSILLIMLEIHHYHDWCCPLPFSFSVIPETCCMNFQANQIVQNLQDFCTLFPLKWHHLAPSMPWFLPLFTQVAIFILTNYKSKQASKNMPILKFHNEHLQDTKTSTNEYLQDTKSSTTYKR